MYVDFLHDPGEESREEFVQILGRKNAEVLDRTRHVAADLPVQHQAQVVD